MEKIVIAIDAMGGDYGPSVTVQAALRSLDKHQNLKLILVGDRATLEAKLATIKSNSKDRIEIHHASEQVLMDELPSKALRTKKDSSMRVAINLVKNLTAQACISAGNTGALMATAHFVLKCLPGIDRPAITTSFPTIFPGKVTHVLDLGANIDSCANYLYQFAIMGSVVAAVVDKIDRPRIALLNIGTEEIKGNDQIKQAAQMIAENPNLNYVGFVEGNDLFKGKVDVIVCDGFIGNIMLKSTEGALKLVGTYVKRNIMRNLCTKVMALLAWPLFHRLRKDLSPEKYNGATLVGLQGIVIKSHGSANVYAFYHAIEKAIIEVENSVPQLIRDELSKVMNRQRAED